MKWETGWLVSSCNASSDWIDSKRDIAMLLSRTQISTQDVTRLCHEIRDIKKGPINNELPDGVSKTSSSTPGQWDICDKHVLSYAENAYNKLCPSPPNDSHDSPARHDSSPPPAPSPSTQTLPEPLPSRTPSPILS